jgi:hypothetical protein
MSDSVLRLVIKLDNEAKLTVIVTFGLRKLYKDFIFFNL